MTKLGTLPHHLMTDLDKTLRKVIDTEVLRPKVLTDNRESHWSDCAKLMWRTGKPRTIPVGTSFQYFFDATVFFESIEAS